MTSKTDPALAIDLETMPKPVDSDRAGTALASFREALHRIAGGEADRPSAAALAALLDREDDPVTQLLSGVYAASPFLASLSQRDPEVVAETVLRGPDAVLQETLAAARPDSGGEPGLNAVMQRLRRAKRRTALVCALADAAGAWPLERVTEALSDLADAALDSAVAYILSDMAGTDHAPPLEGCGIAILGMGKLGARELNYSSDIDIMVLYDPERVAARDPDRLQQDMVRATRTLMRIMDERTRDGYVFRTDLRLRPDPSATPLAVTVRAAETYYESLGQNWERAAMIKARPVAGDRSLGNDFLDHIRPFVWRKHLDFAAISDIQSIKRQINAYRGGGRVAVAGHDIKIGRGGIREIEFFAQTQQLIWGGREPELRPRRTLDALAALAAHGHAKPETVEDLEAAYRYLRALEHRLQMTNDEQTQTLPEDEAELARLAGFMGFGRPDAFAATTR